MSKVAVKLQYIDVGKRLVSGAVYSPNQIDAHGSYASEEEVEAMCMRFLAKDINRRIDFNHNNTTYSCKVAECYIARNDPNYRPGTWVMSVKVEDDFLWTKILKGELNAFSMEIMAKFIPTLVTFFGFTHFTGRTHDEHDHSHVILVETDELGRVIKGKTSIDNGHSHEILLNSITESTDGHHHRYFLG